MIDMSVRRSAERLEPVARAGLASLEFVAGAELNVLPRGRQPEYLEYDEEGNIEVTV